MDARVWQKAMKAFQENKLARRLQLGALSFVNVMLHIHTIKIYDKHTYTHYSFLKSQWTAHVFTIHLLSHHWLYAKTLTEGVSRRGAVSKVGFLWVDGGKEMGTASITERATPGSGELRSPGEGLPCLC